MKCYSDHGKFSSAGKPIVITKCQNGTSVQVNHNRFLGYTKDEDGNLIIVQEDANIVRRIYKEYLQVATTSQIAKGLEVDGIITAAGKAKWSASTLNTILKNEKYMGDALLQKNSHGRFSYKETCKE